MTLTPTSCENPNWAHHDNFHPDARTSRYTEKGFFEHLHSSGLSATLTAAHLGGLCNSTPLTLIGQQITADDAGA